MLPVSEQSLTGANESDQLVLQEIEEALDRSKPRGDLQSRYADLLLKLVNPDGDEIELPLGTHQRILSSDLIEYQKRRDEEKRQGLTEILHISEDERLYN